jgi:hypothetical protein
MTEGFALSCFTENEALLFGENNSRDESHRSNKISMENEFPGDVFVYYSVFYDATERKQKSSDASGWVRTQNKHDI